MDARRHGLFAAAGLYLLAGAGLWIVSGLVGILTAVGAWPDLSYEWSNLLANALYYGPFLLLPVCLLFRKRDASALRLNPVSFGATLGIVCTALLCVAFAYEFDMLWAALLQRLGLNVFIDTYVRPANTGELMRSAISVAIIAPICEELLFRGTILSAWEPRGRKRAVVVCTVLFAMLHGSPLGLPAELIVGAVLALLVLWTDSLFAGMIFHSAYNAVLILLNYVLSGLPSDQTEATGDMIEALGGASGLFSLLFDLLILGLILRFALRLFRRRAVMPEPAEPRTRLSLGTVALLIAGVVTALGLYAVSLLPILGGAP